MLKKRNRLTKHSAFTAIYAIKNILSTEIITMYAGRLKTDKLCPTRVGFVVSKKIHKRATKRNRIKRLMREAVRLIIQKNKFQIFNDYQSFIFIAKSPILEKNFSEINNSIEILFSKLANKNI